MRVKGLIVKSSLSERLSYKTAGNAFKNSLYTYCKIDLALCDLTSGWDNKSKSDRDFLHSSVKFHKTGQIL